MKRHRKRLVSLGLRVCLPALVLVASCGATSTSTKPANQSPPAFSSSAAASDTPTVRSLPPGLILVGTGAEVTSGTGAEKLTASLSKAIDGGYSFIAPFGVGSSPGIVPALDGGVYALRVSSKDPTANPELVYSGTGGVEVLLPAATSVALSSEGAVAASIPSPESNRLAVVSVRSAGSSE